MLAVISYAWGLTASYWTFGVSVYLRACRAEQEQGIHVIIQLERMEAASAAKLAFILFYEMSK